MRIYAAFLLLVYMVPFSRDNARLHTLLADARSGLDGNDAILEERPFVAASRLRGIRTGARMAVEGRVCCRGTSSEQLRPVHELRASGTS